MAGVSRSQTLQAASCESSKQNISSSSTLRAQADAPRTDKAAHCSSSLSLRKWELPVLRQHVEDNSGLEPTQQSY